jgi:O-acetyl-ADP-ribose deacetylase (regulator of RNase III)
MFREVEGDLFAMDVDAIGHGVNCKGLMGAGIAKPFREKFPLMYEEYALMCQAKDFHPGDVFKYYVGDGRWVYNLASQNKPGADADLGWLMQAAHTMMVHAHRYGVQEIALPQIGCGIGGLDYRDVRKVLSDVSGGWSPDLTVVILPS